MTRAVGFVCGMAIPLRMAVGTRGSGSAEFAPARYAYVLLLMLLFIAVPTAMQFLARTLHDSRTFTAADRRILGVLTLVAVAIHAALMMWVR